MRRLIAVAAVLIAAVGLIAATVVWPAPAQALPGPPIPVPTIPGLTGPELPGLPSPITGTCKPPPTPVEPGAGVPSIFDGSPSGATVSRYDRYGYGPHWSTYDLGCAGAASDPGAVIDTWVGNFFYGLATDLVAFSNGVHRLVSPPTFLGAFDRLETVVVTGLHDRVWQVFLPISLLILALLILARAHRQDMHGTLRTVGWALFVMLIVSFVFSYPTRAGRAADQVETQTVSTINGALAGQNNSGPGAAASLEVDSVLYPAWVQGELGKTSGPVVDQFGQRLWDAQALTWDQAKHPSKYMADKKKAFTDTATQVHDTDESAYVALKGQAGDRWGIGLLALGGALLTVPFRIVADLLVLASLVLIRVGVMFAPMLGVIGLHHRMAGLVRGTLSAVGAACINAVAFSAGAAVNTYGVSVLLGSGSGVPLWVGLLLSGLLAFVLWYALKPFRRLTQMVGAAHSPFHQTAAATRGTIQKVGGLVADTAVYTVAFPAGRAIYNRLRHGSDGDGEDERRPLRREAMADAEPAVPLPAEAAVAEPTVNGNSARRETVVEEPLADDDPLAPQPEMVEVEETA